MKRGCRSIQQNWDIITDAMVECGGADGTAPSAHICRHRPRRQNRQRADHSATHLNAKLGAGGEEFKDNGWFVGVEPRRNPEIVVCTLLEEGEHGYSRREPTAQVIKAYVEKQRRQPTKVAGSNNGKVELGGLDRFRRRWGKRHGLERKSFAGGPFSNRRRAKKGAAGRCRTGVALTLEQLFGRGFPCVPRCTLW